MTLDDLGARLTAAPFGTLSDYATGQPIRPATADEHRQSLAAGETGAFRDSDGRTVYVDGGPETSSDSYEVYDIQDAADASSLGYDDIPTSLVIQRDGEYIAAATDLDDARRIIAAALGVTVDLRRHDDGHTSAARWVVA